jgi:hypothetical protein
MFQNISVFSTFHTNWAPVILELERTKKEKKNYAVTKQIEIITFKAIVDMVLRKKASTSGN